MLVDELQSLLNFWVPLDMQDQLTRVVSEDKIKSTLFLIHLDKSPGPDGYTIEFYKAALPIIGKDFIVTVQSFFLKKFIPKGVNTTILALIPKE